MSECKGYDPKEITNLIWPDQTLAFLLVSTEIRETIFLM